MEDMRLTALDARISIHKGEDSGNVEMEVRLRIPKELAERNVPMLIKEGLDLIIKEACKYVGAPVLDDGKFEFQGEEARAMAGVSVDEFFAAKKKGWN